MARFNVTEFEILRFITTVVVAYKTNFRSVKIVVTFQTSRYSRQNVRCTLVYD